ncbi:unnamed protein product [Ilex paraguariensis]|uniref:3-hydroxyisobutyryl-CoA hydrolase n=1 Tax=Ilex paraguariensis TaxID=185542 RepID=A0ABC8SRD5_9AQUA
MIACGLATHYTLNARLAWIEERLGKLITDDPSVIENSLAQYGDLVYPDTRSVLYRQSKFSNGSVEDPVDCHQQAPQGSSIFRPSHCHFHQHIAKDNPHLRIQTIDKCFCHDTVEEITDALEKEVAESYDDWCSKALKKLKEASPLSLKVTLQSIREGRFQPLDQCLAREYRMSLNWISKMVSNDFCEGVRARLVDKDFAPKWDPPSLSEVTKDMVDCYFAPLSELEPELNLPTALREPSM